MSIIQKKFIYPTDKPNLVKFKKRLAARDGYFNEFKIKEQEYKQNPNVRMVFVRRKDLILFLKRVKRRVGFYNNNNAYGWLLEIVDDALKESGLNNLGYSEKKEK